MALFFNNKSRSWARDKMHFQQLPFNVALRFSRARGIVQEQHLTTCEGHRGEQRLDTSHAPSTKWHLGHYNFLRPFFLFQPGAIALFEFRGPTYWRSRNNVWAQEGQSKRSLELRWGTAEFLHYIPSIATLWEKHFLLISKSIWIFLVFFFGGGGEFQPGAIAFFRISEPTAHPFLNFGPRAMPLSGPDRTGYYCSGIHYFVRDIILPAIMVTFSRGDTTKNYSKS